MQASEARCFSFTHGQTRRRYGFAALVFTHCVLIVLPLLVVILIVIVVLAFALVAGGEEATLQG